MNTTLISNTLSLVMQDLNIDNPSDASYISEVEDVLTYHTNKEALQLNTMLNELEQLDSNYFNNHLKQYVLINLCIELYKEDLKEDSENTDAIMFILEEVANENDMNENEFIKLTELVYKELERIGL